MITVKDGYRHARVLRCKIIEKQLDVLVARIEYIDNRDVHDQQDLPPSEYSDKKMRLDSYEVTERDYIPSPINLPDHTGHSYNSNNAPIADRACIPSPNDLPDHTIHYNDNNSTPIAEREYIAPPDHMVHSDDSNTTPIAEREYIPTPVDFPDHMVQSDDSNTTPITEEEYVLPAIDLPDHMVHSDESNTAPISFRESIGNTNLPKHVDNDVQVLSPDEIVDKYENTFDAANYDRSRRDQNYWIDVQLQQL